MQVVIGITRQIWRRGAIRPPTPRSSCLRGHLLGWIMNGLVADTIEVLGRPRNGIWFLSGFWHRVNELDEGNAVISGFQTSEKRAVTFNAKTSTCNVHRAQEHERKHLLAIASRSENTTQVIRKHIRLILMCNAIIIQGWLSIANFIFLSLSETEQSLLIGSDCKELCHLSCSH